MDSNIAHRPGVLKHPNKSHKTGRHRSKGSISEVTKGKANVKTITKKEKGHLNKHEKRNKLKQLRNQKREEILEQKRNRGTHNTPPFLVTVLPTCKPHINEADVLARLFEGCDDVLVTASHRSCHVSCQRFKQRYEFIFPTSLIDYMDATKVSDCLMLLVPVGQQNGGSAADDDMAVDGEDGGEDGCGRFVDSSAEKILACLFNQGLCSVTLCCSGLKQLPVKKQADKKKDIIKSLSSRFPDEKLLTLDTAQDAIMMLNHIGSQKMNRMSYRDLRAHVFASHVAYVQPDSEVSTAWVGYGAGDYCTLQISGYVRGSRLSPNQLLHLPGFGNFQISMIEELLDPHPLIHKNKQVTLADGDTLKATHRPDPAEQESLECEIEPDEMQNEQTFPTEEELKEAEMNFQKKKVKKLMVPKGLSDYQASWFEQTNEDEEDSDGDEDDDDDDDDDGERKEFNDLVRQRDEISMKVPSVKDDGDAYDNNFDEDEEKRLLEKHKEARMERMFPDEIDTPQDQPARVRFQKYIGLESMNNSQWDRSENLPNEYARITRLNNFKAVRKMLVNEILKKDDNEQEEKKVKPGAYVTIHIAEVPSSILELVNSSRPVVTFALLPFEQKLSVLHFLIRRCPGDKEPIRSKDPMVLHVGCHRFKCRPIYSKHTTAFNHKFEKFFYPDTTLVASVYAPIIISPANVLMFKDGDADDNKLVGTGTLLSVNPDRIIVKRIILSGHPFKINRSSTVVRYMFFNREDILWYKPVNLKTKRGALGYIVEPLGTHGHMKCKFFDKVKSHDVVLMKLYKRVYPKWNDFKQLYN
ncbi:hypothetical protein HELRODRAFT_108226 [Helobdella robusta]|uniref:Pre-rRNA-processing protein TSR1 homolog n=1 Tax=Helobdella robusta TaxID=6412 RepID=T1EEH2_HELRO|nr:hypothetical protein HELRODRAFT_108226 [Helobdella robusta]ESN92998.1 hypothetical protein HELRODRAFT_108226 [Helobdella robusta]